MTEKTLHEIRLAGFRHLFFIAFDETVSFGKILLETGIPSEKVEKWTSNDKWRISFLEKLYRRLIAELPKAIPRVNPEVVVNRFGLNTNIDAVPTYGQIATKLAMVEDDVIDQHLEMVRFIKSDRGKSFLKQIVREAAQEQSNSITPLSDRELDLLLSVHEFNHHAGKLPTNQWLAAKLIISESAVGDLKKRLKDKGYLDHRFSDAKLTQEAINIIDSLMYIAPTQISVLGEVQAGPSEAEDRVLFNKDIQFLSGPDFEFTAVHDFIAVPNIKGSDQVFALKVIGKSMEKENILEGDYVILKKFLDGEAPKDGQLIVTMYLPLKYAESLDEISSESWMDQIPEDFWKGPTLKRYFQRDKMIRLSWLKDFDNSSFTIKALMVRPIAKVLCAYRIYKDNL